VTAAPPWVEYELTDRGRELADALGPIAVWGKRHLSAAAPAAAASAE
jgi:DNA-binding HxlR family transcriptional regulator